MALTRRTAAAWARLALCLPLPLSSAPCAAIIQSASSVVPRHGGKPWLCAVALPGLCPATQRPTRSRRGSVRQPSGIAGPPSGPLGSRALQRCVAALAAGPEAPQSRRGGVATSPPNAAAHVAGLRLSLYAAPLTPVSRESALRRRGMATLAVATFAEPETYAQQLEAKVRELRACTGPSWAALNRARHALLRKHQVAVGRDSSVGALAHRLQAVHRNASCSGCLTP